MAKQPKPRWKDGRIDAEWLAGAGVAFMAEWLEARLSGRDPYVPLDPRVDEDPEELFVALVREVGLHHAAADLVGRAALRLLDRARAAAPEVPAYFGSLMRLCQRVRLPQTSAWFVEPLDALSRGAEQSEQAWGGHEVTEPFAFAAAVQAPGHVDAASRASWERLLRQPRYATIAFMALSTTFTDRAQHLDAWWAHCDAADRARELDYMLEAAVRDEGEARVRETLRSAVREAGLTREVDAVFERLGLAKVFDPCATAPASAPHAAPSVVAIRDRIRRAAYACGVSEGQAA
jgi:hypothetical protein